MDDGIEELHHVGGVAPSLRGRWQRAYVPSGARRLGSVNGDGIFRCPGQHRLAPTRDDLVEVAGDESRDGRARTREDRRQDPLLHPGDNYSYNSGSKSQRNCANPYD
jgi:hypothetical protein